MPKYFQEAEDFQNLIEWAATGAMYELFSKPSGFFATPIEAFPDVLGRTIVGGQSAGNHASTAAERRGDDGGRRGCAFPDHAGFESTTGRGASATERLWSRQRTCDVASVRRRHLPLTRSCVSTTNNEG